VADFTTNADFWLADWARGAKVHRGFKNALDEVWEGLFPYLAALQRRGCKIWMTGHSLGAALATLAADRFGEAQGVYTFGSPRVGNRRFKENYSVRTYRFVNGNDLVARVPPAGIYEHVGEPRFIDHEGRSRDRMTESTRDRYNCAGECGEKVSLEKNNLTKTPVFVPDAVIDHVPLLYAVLIWNNLVDVRHSAE
jgi:predicted lipase